MTGALQLLLHHKTGPARPLASPKEKDKGALSAFCHGSGVPWPGCLATHPYRGRELADGVPTSYPAKGTTGACQSFRHAFEHLGPTRDHAGQDCWERPRGGTAWPMRCDFYFSHLSRQHPRSPQQADRFFREGICISKAFWALHTPSPGRGPVLTTAPVPAEVLGPPGI
jgi:hypothetical protein